VQIGGGQERGRRGGTLNAPGIVGLGMACEILRAEQAAEWPRIAALRERFERELRSRCGMVHVIGEGAPRLPNTCCACFEGLPSEPIVVLLSEAGVCVSAGAACSSGSMEVSPVLRAMGVPPEIGHGQIRFSFGRFNTNADVDRALEIVPRVVEKVRSTYASA
jgi:cysteine desulfurase